MKSVSKLAGVLAGAALMSLLSNSVSAHAAGDDMENGYKCDSATIRYVGEEKVTLPFNGDLRDFNDAPDTTTVGVYNAIAAGCEVVGNAPKTGASTRTPILTHDLESPSRGNGGKIRTFKGTFLVSCRNVDAGDGNGVVTGSQCRAMSAKSSYEAIN